MTLTASAVKIHGWYINYSTGLIVYVQGIHGTRVDCIHGSQPRAFSIEMDEFISGFEVWND
jgi:hypothetical protein